MDARKQDSPLVENPGNETAGCGRIGDPMRGQSTPSSIGPQTKGKAAGPGGVYRTRRTQTGVARRSARGLFSGRRTPSRIERRSHDRPKDHEKARAEAGNLGRATFINSAKRQHGMCSLAHEAKARVHARRAGSRGKTEKKPPQQRKPSQRWLAVFGAPRIDPQLAKDQITFDKTGPTAFAQAVPAQDHWRANP